VFNKFIYIDDRLITDSSLRNIAALNNYLLGNVASVNNAKPSPPLLDLNQLNHNGHTNHVNNGKNSLNNSLNMDSNDQFLLKKVAATSNDFNSLKVSCSKCSNSYLDLLKDELVRRIDTQVSRGTSFFIFVL
jgi:hypothetical protein